MDLTPYVVALRNDLAVAAEAGGQEARALAERLAAPLDSSARLAFLDVLSVAASEITRDLAPGSVELRLRGREPSFVVTAPPTEPPADEPSFQVPSAAQESDSSASSAEDDDVAMTRINLRLTQDLKDRVEAAARQSGLSVNAWLVRSATAALEGGGSRPSARRAAMGGERYTGWVR